MRCTGEPAYRVLHTFVMGYLVPFFFGDLRIVGSMCHVFLVEALVV